MFWGCRYVSFKFLGLDSFILWGGSFCLSPEVHLIDLYWRGLGRNKEFSKLYQNYALGAALTGCALRNFPSWAKR